MECTHPYAKAKFSMIEKSCIRLVGAPSMEIGKRRGGSAVPSPRHRHAAILQASCKAAQKSLLTKVLPVARVGNFACSSCPFDQFNGDWKI